MVFLVVDDSKLARFSLIKSLKEFEPDAEVIEADNGLKAVEMYREYSPVMVFLDLTMPVMDGFEALKQIMQMDPGAVVVVVSADIQAQAQAQVLADGAKLMVPKPISPEKMHEVFKKLVM